jgi:phosphatidylglycerol:prolipoprotein diacylglycerol transferase
LYPEFRIGPLSLRAYDLMTGLGVLACLWLVYRRALGSGLSAGRAVAGAVGIILAGLAGARLGVVILDLRYYASNWQEIFSPYGTGFQGGLAAVALAVPVAARLLRIPPWKLFDLLAPGLALGQAIGRIGCLLNGCCCGRPTGSFAGVYLPDAWGTWAVRYPTQVMHAGADLAILGALSYAARRSPPQGYVWLLYLILYSTERVLIDLLREPGPTLAGLSAARVVGAATILAAGALLGWRHVHRQRNYIEKEK